MRASLAMRWRLSSQPWIGLVFDLLDEFGRIVDVLQQPNLGVAEHLIERRRRLDHGGAAGWNPPPAA